MAGSVRRRVAAGVVALLALGAAGCGGGGEGAAGPASTEPTERAETTTTTAPATTTTALTEEQAVLAAYQGYWDTWLAANDPPDPDHPGLERYYTGRSLERARAEISERAAARQSVFIPPHARYAHNATLQQSDSARAIVIDCSIDDGHLLDSRTGLVLDDTVGTALLEASMEKIRGQWKVESIQRMAEWDGIAGCAA